MPTASPLSFTPIYNIPPLAFIKPAIVFKITNIWVSMSGPIAPAGYIMVDLNSRLSVSSPNSPTGVSSSVAVGAAGATECFSSVVTSLR